MSYGNSYNLLQHIFGICLTIFLCQRTQIWSKLVIYLFIFQAIYETVVRLKVN